MHAFSTYGYVDLFAGPGGWDLAARRLGLRGIGIEFDHAARLTRRAAGFATIEDDVRKWGPRCFPNARGLIASPPCQTFSAAGKGAGRRALDVVLGQIEGMADYHRRGWEWHTGHEWEDERTGLVLEPLRWALDAIRLGRPYEWLAFEQVPTVLPVWQAMADVLRAEGYSVAVGNLQAEQYGVPQTRKRAVLIARYVGPYSVIHDGDERMVYLPDPTHSRYHTRDKARLDPGVLPWVSMAQALGWEDQDVTLASPAHARAYDRSIPRGMAQPAPTIASGHAAAAWAWTRPATTIVGSFNAATVAAPGYRVSPEDGSRQNAPGSVRVSVEERGVLQSFPLDYPWQGSKSKRDQQVGNAIPPLLAEAVLRQVV